MDFSVVCPTELLALQDNITEFEARNVEIITISTDSIYTHAAWAKLPRDQGGIGGTTLKMVSDSTQALSRAFGSFDEKSGVALRGTFLIDQELMVLYGSINNLSFGRSISEILRVIDAIQFALIHKNLCPANWRPGQQGLDGLHNLK